VKLQVRNSLCTGCGICAENCPRQAISLRSGKAFINQIICRLCGVCLSICPRGAILEVNPVSQAGLMLIVGSLKQKADSLVERIEKLKQRGTSVKQFRTAGH